MKINSGELVILDLLKEAASLGASDVYISKGSVPFMRVLGELARMDAKRVSSNDIDVFTRETMIPRYRETFLKTGQIRFVFSLTKDTRCRVDAFMERGEASFVVRIIPQPVPSYSSLRLPKKLNEFVEKSRGVVLICGGPSSGKTTTLSATVEKINETASKHVVYICRSTEYPCTNKKSFINQIEVEASGGPQNAVLHALRLNPDLIVIDDVLDANTVRHAVFAAENGVGVFLSVLSPNSALGIANITELVEHTERREFRLRLSRVLEGVIYQELVKGKKDKMVLATEVLVAIQPVRNLLRDGKIFAIAETIPAGTKYGMQTLESSLEDLARKGLI